MSDPLVETRRLSMQRFRESEAHLLLALNDDPDVMRWINGGIPASRADTEQRILPYFIVPRSFPFGFWAARAAGTFVGWISMVPDDDRVGGMVERAELGYRLHRHAWGKGFATEAAGHLLELVFARTSLACVHATTYARNLASIAVLRKLGLREVARFRPSAAQIGAARTHRAAEGAPWEDEDIRFELTRAQWMGAAA